MNAENQQPCTCELCQPNWFLGRDDAILTPQPAVQPARQVTLEEAHLRKQTLQRVELELAIST